MKDIIIGALVLDKIIFDEEEKSRNIEVRGSPPDNYQSGRFGQTA